MAATSSARIIEAFLHIFRRNIKAQAWVCLSVVVCPFYVFVADFAILAKSIGSLPGFPHQYN